MIKSHLKNEVVGSAAEAHTELEFEADRFRAAPAGAVPRLPGPQHRHVGANHVLAEIVAEQGLKSSVEAHTAR